MDITEPKLPDASNFIKHLLIEVKDDEGLDLVNMIVSSITNLMPWRVFYSRKGIEQQQIGNKKWR